MKKFPFARLLAVVLSSALLMTAPGLPFYQALAAEIADSGEALAAAGAEGGRGPQPGSQTAVSANAGTVSAGLGFRGTRVDLSGAGAVDQQGRASGVLGSEGDAGQAGTLDSQASDPSEGADLGSQAAINAAVSVAADASNSNGVVAGPRSGIARRAVERLKRFFGSRQDGPGVVVAPAATPAASNATASAPQSPTLGPPQVPVPSASPSGKLPRSIWGLVIGHSTLIMLGINLHIYSQAFLVYGLTGSKTMIGVVRNVHFGAYTAASFLPIGDTISTTDYKYVYNGTSFLRAALMGAIPFLFLSGHLVMPALLLIVALNPIFQNMMTTADRAGRASFIGKDPKAVKDATSKITQIENVAGLFLPMIAGWIVSALVAHFGDPGGYAMAYGGYAALLLLATPVFTWLIRDPRHDDPEVKVKPQRNLLNIFVPAWEALKGVSLLAGLTQTLRRARDFYADFKSNHGLPATLGVLSAGTFLAPLWLTLGVASIWFGRAQAAFAKARAALARGRDAAASTEQLPWRERAARFFEPIKSAEGLAVILRSPVLSTLVGMGAIEMFLSDALSMVVLPNYIIDVINPRLDLGHLPLIGSLLSTRAGIFTLMMVANGIGGFLGSRWTDGDKGDRRIEALGHPKLYKLAAMGSVFFCLMLLPLLWMPGPAAQSAIQEGYKLLSAASTPGARDGAKAMIEKAMSTLPMWTFWASLGIATSVQFLKALFHTPLDVAMEPIKRQEIPNDKVGPLYAAFSMIDVALMGTGALALGAMLDVLSIQWSMLIITAALMVTVVFEWHYAPKWLGKTAKGWLPGKGKRNEPKA